MSVNIETHDLGNGIELRHFTSGSREGMSFIFHDRNERVDLEHDSVQTLRKIMNDALIC